MADDQLRPQTLDSIIGQDKIRRSLDIYIESARIRKTALDHVLLAGPPGLGKTTFAFAIANGLGQRVAQAPGPSLSIESWHNLMWKLRSDSFIVFVDEIHAIPKETYEVLYGFLEDFSYQGRAYPAFTMIGATTDPGKLPSPFRDRFGIRLSLDFYEQKDIETILARSLGILAPSLSADAEALSSLAIRSRGTPRVANMLLRRTIDVLIVQARPRITVALVDAAMEIAGVDRRGLTDIDRRILNAVVIRYKGGPVGLNAIAASIGESAANLESAYEPWLVREGFLIRGQRGREITTKGLVALAEGDVYHGQDSP